MKRRPIFKILMPAISCFIILMLIMFSAYTYSILNSFYMSLNKEELTVAANVFKSQITSSSNTLDRTLAMTFCSNVFNNHVMRYTLILDDGEVLSDSWKNADDMENHADRREIIRVLNGEDYSESIRYSSTIGKDMLYVTIPFTENGSVAAVLRVSKPLADIKSQFYQFLVKPFFATLILLVVSILIIYFISKKLSQPLEELKNVALKFTNGDENIVFPNSSIEEIDILAITMDAMVAKLESRISTITKQRDEEQALMMNMTEAVIVVNRDRELLKVNRAAEHMFDFAAEDVVNKKLVKVLYNSDLLETVDRVFAANKPVETSMRAETSQGTFNYRVNGVKIPSVNLSNIKAVFVITDITHLRKLETMRQDFVANVSHELRTPITSIIGFAETLVGEKKLDKKDIDKFNAIVYKQANRLKTIIDDLLVLSRLDYNTDLNSLDFMPANISHVAQNVVQTVSKEAKKNCLEIKVDVDETILVNMNIQLIELAIQNLLINAIKYSGEDSKHIELSVFARGREAIVKVKDFGFGIPADSIDRIFERFYRVDKGRSRKVGGTGLGLSLVKRIAILHAGHVSVESTLGKGSTFYLHLPYDSAMV
jgi:two-component system, OmpR family, phosphate regulon sensor histidine kinase PhoR